MSATGHSEVPPGLAGGIAALDRSGMPWRMLGGGPDESVVLVAAGDRKRAADVLAAEALPLRAEAAGPPQAFLFYDRGGDRWPVLRTVSDAADAGAPPTRPGTPIRLAGRGAIVALLAPDGAGKSTLVNALEAYPGLPIWSAYLGLYPRGARRFPVPGIGFAARVLRQWRHYLLARRRQAEGMVVVFDRYPYDARLPPGRPGSTLDRLRRWLLGRVLPPPDLAIVLDAPAEILHERKAEQELGELRRQRGQYLDLAGRLPCRTVIVDASRDEARVRREVADLIWRESRARSARTTMRRARGG